MCLLFSTGCRHAVDVGPPVEPLTAPREIETRLRRLRSFAFQLEYSTDRPFELGARFSGVRDSTDREDWRGVWWRGTEQREFRVVGDGPVQYERVASDWVREPRGNESRIFDHISHILRADFEFVAESDRRYRYRFDTRLPLLDPSGGKRLYGSLELDRRTGLLQEVRCREEDGPAYWTLKLSRFNRAGEVRVPFLPVQEFLLVPARTQSRKELGLSVSIARERLEKLRLRHRLFRRRGELLLQLESEKPTAVVDFIIGPGLVELWTGEEISLTTEVESLPESTFEVGGDAARRVRLRERLGGNSDFQVEVGLDFVVRPLLSVAAIDEPGKPGLPENEAIVLMLDGRAADIGRASGGRVDFGGVGTREHAGAYAAQFVPAVAVVAGLPVTVGLRVAQMRRLP